MYSHNLTTSVLDYANCSFNEQLAACSPQKWYLTILSAAQMIASIFGIILMLAVSYVGSSQLVLHRNAKLLLANHFFAALLHCVCEIATHVIDLRRKMDRTGNWTSSNTAHCLYGEIPQAATLTAIMITLCMLALERIRATIDYRTYEKAGGFHGYLIVAIQWTIVVVAMVILVVNTYTNIAGERKLACLLTTNNSTQVVSLLMLAVAVAEIISLATFYLLLRFNQRKRLTLTESSCALTEKYQIDENIRSIKLMIPMVWTHFLCLFPPMCFFAILPKLSSCNDPRTRAIFTVALDWTPWYCVILPIVIFWRQKALRVALRKKLQEMGLNKVNPLESQSARWAQEQSRHFTMLNNMWDSRKA